MDYFKEITLSICVTVLVFGILKNIMPGNFYIKYMRLIFSMIFIIITANAIGDVVAKNDFSFENPKIEYKNKTTTEMLSTQIKTYLNNKLNENNFLAVCRNVNVINDLDNYYILDITISDNSDKSEVIKFLTKITGLNEEQIYVEP